MPSSTLLRRNTNLASNYTELKRRVQEVLLTGQQNIEQEKVRTYWETGKLIQSHILANKSRADYGKQVINRLAEELEVSDSVLRRTIQFFEAFPISAPARKLTWAHYCEVIPIKDPKTRFELVARAEKSEWSRDDLRRTLKEEFQTLKEPEQQAPYGNVPPLKAKLGALYTYRLIQPDQIQNEKPYVLIDLGFAAYRRLYKTDLKPGSIIETAWDTAKEDYKIQKSQKDDTSLFTFKAVIERVVDGDTLRVKVDLGFDLWTRQYLRLRGVDCPEMDTPEGRRAKTFIENEVKDAPYVLITSTRSDKYDRYLADLWVPNASAEKSAPLSSPKALVGDPAGNKGVFINQKLLDKKHAVRMRE